MLPARASLETPVTQERERRTDALSAFNGSPERNVAASAFPGMGAVIRFPAPRPTSVSPPRRPQVGAASLAGHRADLLALSLMFVFVTGSMSLSALVSVSGQLQQGFGLSDGQIGLLTSVFMGFYGLAALVSGPFASRWGGRLLLVTCGAFFVGSMILGMSSSFGCLLVGRAIQGIGGGTVVPICNPLMSQAVSPDRIRRCWAVFGCGWGIGQMATLLIMPAVARAGGFRAVFFAIAGLALIAGLGALSQRVVRVMPKRSKSSLGSRAMAASLLRVAKNRRLLLLGVVCIAHLAIPVGIVAWTPSFLGEYRGATLGLAAYLTAGLGACQVLGSLAGAAMAGRWGKHRVILASLGTMTVAVGLIAIVPGRMAAVTMVLLAGFCSFALFRP